MSSTQLVTLIILFYLCMSIVIDQLDKQSADLAKWFFSYDVEKILLQNIDTNEAEFVHLVREWYEACDARGIHIYDRLQRKQNLYNYLCAWFDVTDFPAPTKYRRGTPIQTYQMIMQSISTRMQLWYHCPINQRSLSTL